MSTEQQQAGQNVEAYLTHDVQKEESSEANKNESVLVITAPSISYNELDSSVKSISNQNADEIILNLPDTFIADCSLENPADEIIYSDNIGQIIDDVDIEEHSPHDDNNINKQQDFYIICNDLQTCDDETMPHYNAKVIIEPVSISSTSPIPQETVFTTDQVDIEIPTKNIEQEHNEAETVNENKMTNKHLEDMDYIPIEKNDDEKDSVIFRRPSRGRKRKIADQNRDIRKKRANTNQDYINVKGKLVKSKKFTGHNFDCLCPKQCTQKLSVEERENEFNKFWSAGSFEARCALLQSYVKESDKKRCYSLKSKRLYTRKYYMRNQEICKKALLNTLSISQSRIDKALVKHRNNESLHDKRGEKSGGKNSITDEQLKEMRDFIEHLPKYKSHYCRESSSVNFLAPNLNLPLLYEKYKIDRPNAVSFSRFRQCFQKDFNLKFKKPQKDTCLHCDIFKAKIASANCEGKIILENEHKQHLEEANNLRLQMKTDLLAAKTDNLTETLTFDLEKTHSLPKLPTNVLYYKRQLNLYNLGIHCGSTNRGFFYVWLEHEGGRGTQEVGSCLRKFVKEKLKPGVTHLILWSDSCGGQNRSINMVLIMLHILQTHDTLEKVTLRFLKSGHTYLPNDSEFGDVECVLKKHSRLYTADDFINIMKNCRRKNKFEVIKMTTNDFYSIKPILNQITNRKMDAQKNKLSWLKTHEIQLKKSEPTTLFMKTNLSCEASSVDIGKGPKKRRKLMQFDVDLPLLYPEGRELSNAKIKDLKEVLKLIPADAKPFYNFLKTVKGGDFTDDVDGFGSTLDFETEDETLLKEENSACEK